MAKIFHVERTDNKITLGTNGTTILLNSDLTTDRWLNSITNTFLGVDVVNFDILNHSEGIEGYYNVFIGYKSGAHITTGYVNTGIGANNLDDITTGYYNTSVGDNGLVSLTTGYGNTSIGVSTGNSLTTGNLNVFLGYKAGYYETGSNKLFIDNATRANEADGRVKALIYGVFDAAPADQTLTVNAVLDVSENIQIDSTQVIGNRVVDARCDDTINSGDATTDGVIDALRDAMITHGLIAAV